jgi:hypothetical protein
MMRDSQRRPRAAGGWHHHRWRQLALLLAGSSLVAACANPLLDDRIEALPDEDPGGESQFHRHGQPCLLCHGPYEGAEPELSVAGTLFYLPESADYSKAFPVGGTDGQKFLVRVIDANTETRDLRANCMGNFFVAREDWDPAFPLLVQVLLQDDDDPELLKINVEMATRIGREGDCAFCHDAQANFGAPSPVSPGLITVRGIDGDYQQPQDFSCEGAAGIPKK